MNPAIALILTLVSIILVVAHLRFGSIGKAWSYLRRPERKLARNGIMVFMGGGILVGILSLAFCRDADAAELKWAQYSYIYLGVDYPMLNRPSPQCWDDGVDNKTTSNGGVTLNGLTYGPLHVNAKYTHHSCAFNSDRNLYDAAGVEVIWYFFDRRKR